MGVTFRANIRWPENDLLFPADWFGVRPPQGLDLFHVRAPKYLQVLEMQKRLRSSAVRSGSSAPWPWWTAWSTPTSPCGTPTSPAQWRRLPGPDGKP